MLPSVPKRREHFATPIVRLELRDERVAEDADRDLERVELVERVLAPFRRVEVELERDRVAAVRDLEDHARLEVLRATRAVVVAVRLAVKLSVRRVLDVDVHERASVEPRQVEQRALVDASAVWHAHDRSSLGSPSVNVLARAPRLAGSARRRHLLVVTRPVADAAARAAPPRCAPAGEPRGRSPSPDAAPAGSPGVAAPRARCAGA